MCFAYQCVYTSSKRFVTKESTWFDNKNVNPSSNYATYVCRTKLKWEIFTNISVSAKAADFTDLSRCSQTAVIFLTHADNLHKKAQWIKSRQLSYRNASSGVFINKETRWTMEHTQGVAAETKASSLIRLIKNYSKILKCCNLKTSSSYINPDFYFLKTR